MSKWVCARDQVQALRSVDIPVNDPCPVSGLPSVPPLCVNPSSNYHLDLQSLACRPRRSLAQYVAKITWRPAMFHWQIFETFVCPTRLPPWTPSIKIPCFVWIILFRMRTANGGSSSCAPNDSKDIQCSSSLVIRDLVDILQPLTQHELGILAQRLCVDGHHCFVVHRTDRCSRLAGLLFCILIGSPQHVVLPWNTPCPPAARCYRLDPWMLGPTSDVLHFGGLLLAHSKLSWYAFFSSHAALWLRRCSTQSWASQLEYPWCELTLLKQWVCRAKAPSSCVRPSANSLCPCPHDWVRQARGVWESRKIVNNVGRNPSALFQPPPHRARPDGWSSSPRRPPFARFTVLLFQPTALHANVIGAAACVHFWVLETLPTTLSLHLQMSCPAARAHRDDIWSPSPMTNQALSALRLGRSSTSSLSRSYRSWCCHICSKPIVNALINQVLNSSLNCSMSLRVICSRIPQHSPSSTQICDDDWQLHQC